MNHLREMIQDDLSKKNFDAPSLKRVLRGRVCYKLVSEHGNNTCLLGLTKESGNISFLENFKGEGILPYPIQ
jgi:hypothetical protein